MDFIIILLLILFDQGSKLIARFNLKPIDTLNLINDYFSFTYVENRGAAFGNFSNHRWLLIGITALVIIAMIIYLATHRKMKLFLKIGLIMVIAGAIGNLIDRIYLGYVVDFIHVYFKQHDMPVFNIADICVVCGTLLLAFTMIVSKE